MADLERISTLRERAASSRQVADRDEAEWLDAVIAAVEGGETWSAVARQSRMARTTLVSRVAVYRERRSGVSA